MKSLRHFVALEVLMVGLLTVGCASPEKDDDPLPVETKTWEVVDNNYQFYTNDTARYGWGYWYTISGADADTFQEFTGVATKVSGAANQGYGFLFCMTDSDNFYRLLITTQGSYSVAKKLNGVWSTIIAWSDSGDLNQGFKKENTIRVTRSTSGLFEIYFNDHYTDFFVDSSMTADSFSAFASVGDAENERFPDTPEDMRFRFTSPSVFPQATRSAGGPVIVPLAGPDTETTDRR